MVAPTTIQVQDVSKRFGDLHALQAVALTAGGGQFVSLVGPSGCGKSTLFNIVAGLLTPDSGRVMLGEDDVTGQAGHVGYMLQRDLLLPWRTVLDNVVLGLDVQGVPRSKSLPGPRASWAVSGSSSSRTRTPRRCREACVNGAPSSGRSSTTLRCSCSTSR